MHILTRGLLIAAVALAGCTQNRVASNGNRPATAAGNPNAVGNRRMITGSNVPQPVNRPTYSPTSSTVPLESQARARPGLTPTEPVVGAGHQSDYRLSEPSTGASPAGGGSDPGTGQFTPQ